MNRQLYNGVKSARLLFRNKWINTSLKLVFVLLLCIVMYNQTLGRDNFFEIYATFKERLQESESWYLIVALLLMPVNWLLETLKWKALVDPIEKVPLFRAIKGVMIGVSLSLFTPNRIGEYGGRILVVKPENNVKTVVATIVGSFSQLVVLLVFGMIGTSYFVHLFLETPTLVEYGIGLTTVLGSIVLIFFYFNVDLAIPIFRRLPLLRRLVKHMEILRTYGTDLLMKALSYSFLRYLTYSVQYYLILCFFGIEIDLLVGLSAIATIFLIQTSIPMPPISGLLVRGEVALNIWGFFQLNVISILAATFGLWLINVILPALFGTIFILNINVLKSLGYDKEVD